MGTLASSVLASPGSKGAVAGVGSGGRGRENPWGLGATVLSVIFPQRPSCSGESWEMVMEREERKSGKKGVGGTEGKKETPLYLPAGKLPSCLKPGPRL